jgi:shikimate dehydrogenase
VSLAERADLVVLAGGAAPSGVLQPFHTVLDLTGDAAGAARAGAAVLPLAALPALRLALQLEHATGQRFHPEALAGAVTLVGGH